MPINKESKAVAYTQTDPDKASICPYLSQEVTNSPHCASISFSPAHYCTLSLFLLQALSLKALCVTGLILSLQSTINFTESYWADPHTHSQTWASLHSYALHSASIYSLHPSTHWHQASILTHSGSRTTSVLHAQPLGILTLLYCCSWNAEREIQIRERQ